MNWSPNIPKVGGIYWAVSKHVMSLGLALGPFVVFVVPCMDCGRPHRIHPLGATESTVIDGLETFGDWLWGDAIEVPGIPPELTN